MILCILCNRLQKKNNTHFEKPICDPNILCVNLSILQNKLSSKCQDWLKNTSPFLNVKAAYVCQWVPEEDTAALLTY